MVGLVGRVTRHSTEYIENTFFFVLQTRYHKERERVGDHREGETAFSIWGNIASESKRKSEESNRTQSREKYRVMVIIMHINNVRDCTRSHKRRYE